jgi:simple sugar transport system ATP-binding protein
MSASTSAGSGAPPAIEVIGMTKYFGRRVALDRVSITFEPGSFHAILGENGAGKSTLVKCMMGYYRPDAGRIVVNGKERAISNPGHAHQLGLGMVYQHFTLVPSMTVAENLIVSEAELPLAINWVEERERIDDFQRTMPFKLDCDRPVSSLAAGEKQKLEILKQLFLGRRVLILDEPTTVLTPAEADQLLGLMQEKTVKKQLTVIMITHKLREVLDFAGDVTVLRGGRQVGGGAVKDLTGDDLVRMMIAGEKIPEPAARVELPRNVVHLELRNLTVCNDNGLTAIRGVSLKVHAGEIVGVAGVSGNGQRELVEVLAGQRQPESGDIFVRGALYSPTRREMRLRKVFLLPEEPLRNGCVRTMSVAENLAFRNFDEPKNTRCRWLIRRRAMRKQALDLITRCGIRPQSPEARLETLSGGNVQRTVLARELSEELSVLIAQNPCAGLDVVAVAETRSRIMAARNSAAAVLLISEDLDELLELADRIVVMFEGECVYETPREHADVQTIGRYMASRT